MLTFCGGRHRFCLDGTVWTPPLVTLVICCGSILVFLTIIFVFVFVETRRASGKVAPQHSSAFMARSKSIAHLSAPWRLCYWMQCHQC